MVYYLKRIHYKFKNLIKTILNVLFVFLHSIYAYCYRIYIDRKRAKYAQNDPYQQHLIELKDVVTEDNDNLVQEMKMAKNSQLPMSKTMKLINPKNIWLDRLSLLIIGIIYCYFIHYLITYALSSSKQDVVVDEPIKVEDVIDVDKTIWYYADLRVKKFKTLTEMKEQYYPQLLQPCQPLTLENMESNSIEYNNNLFDLTLLYHILCHLSTDETTGTGHAIPIIPKYVNVSKTRSVVDKMPFNLFSDVSQHILSTHH